MIRNLLINRQNWAEIAVIEAEKNISYRQLAQKARAIQRLLPQNTKENIAVFLPNGGDYIAAFYGIIMSGKAAFPLNAAMTKHEIIPLLAQASVRTVISARKFRSLFSGLAQTKAPGLNVIYTEDLPLTEEAPISDNNALTVTATVGGDEPMALLSTSGTTGKAKIVQLSENNVAAAVFGYIDKMNFDGTDADEIKFVFGAPFSSAYGMMILSVCLIKSFPIVLIKDNFTLEAFYKTIATQRITHYEGGAVAALMMEQMAGRPIPYDISSLRYLAFGGSKVSGQTIRRLYDAYPGIKFYQGYGMTEAAPLITKSPEKPDSVGTAIKGVKIAIEAEGTITDTPYIKGEIVVKGPNIMLGYYQNEAATNKAIKNGYLFTGDIGYLDEDGDLYICGRKKNIIIVRGFNVHPEEVEECIWASSLVKDCRVYGHADALGNETVCADIVPLNQEITAEDIRVYCHAHLAAYKQPQTINICDEIRKNASGKTERAKGGQQ